MSKDFVVKHIEVSLEQNNLGAAFSRNKKEKGYLLTNSSSINNLKSYKSLDIPET